MKSLLKAIVVSILFVSSTGYIASAIASLNDGLIAHYPLDGSANDESGNANHGTPSGSPLFVPGVMGQAAKFDGVDDIIRLPNGLLKQEQFSVSIFIKPGEGNSNGGTKPYHIFDAWTGGEIVALEYGESIDRNQSEGNVDLNGIGDYLVGSFHPAYNNTVTFGERHLYHKVQPSFKASWHHVVLSYDGTVARFYLDGALVKEYVFDESVRTYFAYSRGRSANLEIINFTLGASLRNSTFYSGLIDEVRIYDRVITQEEVRAIGKTLIDSCGAYCDPIFTANLSGLQDPPNTITSPEAPLPVLDERKRNVAVLVHGWNSSPAAWSDDTKSMMEAYLSDNGVLCSTSTNADPCWELVAWNWQDAAKTLLPDWAYNNAKIPADVLVAWLTKKFGHNLNHLHLIAHSAGSKLIDRVAKKLLQQKKNSEPSPASLHLTFLDPYTPLDTDKMDYGKLDNSIIPNFSESYITHNLPTTGIGDLLLAAYNLGLANAEMYVARLTWENTKGPLTNSYNIFVDGLDSEGLLDRAKLATLWSVQNHAWPYQFYQCSVTPDNAYFYGEGIQTSQPCPDDHNRYGFGFVNALEYAPYSTIATLREIWKPGNSCTAYSTTTCTDPLNTYIKRTVVNTANATVDFGKTIISETGTLILNTAKGAYNLAQDLGQLLNDYGEAAFLPAIQRLDLYSGSPAWVRLPIRIDGPANYLTFKFKFTQEGPSILRAFIHGKEVWSADQRFYTIGKLWDAEMGLGSLSPGSYEIAFRLDPLTDVQTSVQLSEIDLGSMVVEEVPNVPPTANAGPARTVRLGSVVTLDGSTSADPDNVPAPLSYAWTQVVGPSAPLNHADGANPVFVPNSHGVYRFSLTVNDGADSSTPSEVEITVPPLGDIDLDGDVDNNDLNQILAARNKPASGPNDLRDLDGNLKIDALDARKLTTLCTRSRCATQ